jgi:hypothetical protein
MTSTKSLTASERHARFVLTAWDDREFTQLKVLTQTPFTGIEALPAEERERMDLVQEIGRSLLAWGSFGYGQNAANRNVALALLRHLARCDEAAEAEARVTFKTSVPPEMPASARHSRYVQ